VTSPCRRRQFRGSERGVLANSWTRGQKGGIHWDKDNGTDAKVASRWQQCSPKALLSSLEQNKVNQGWKSPSRGVLSSFPFASPPADYFIGISFV